MGLHLILGPPGAGKAGRAVACLLDAARAGQSAFLCVPGAVDRDRFLRELAGQGGGSLLGVEVGTFDQLVARIAGSPPVRRTDRAMERIVVRDALAQVSELAPARQWSGFVETARRHVDRLRRARVWGGAYLEQVESELPGGSIAAWRSVEEQVGALLQQRRLRDDAWFERRAAAAVRRGDVPLDRVVVYGFDELPPSRMALVERLAGVVEVSVALSWRPGRNVYERASRMRDRWRAAGAFVEELPAGTPEVPLLAWLADECFEPAPAPRPDVPDPDLTPVAFIECCGALQEAEEVVRAVVELRTAGCAWEDIVVASANVQRLAPVLLAACRRAAIPVRLQAPRAAVDIPVGRVVHDVLLAIDRDDPMQLVAALRHDVIGADPARLRAAELQLRRGRIHRDVHVDDAALLACMPAEVGALVRARSSTKTAAATLRSWLATLRPRDAGELDLLLGVGGLLDSLAVAADDVQGVSIADVIEAIARFKLPAPDRSDAGVVVVAAIDDLRSVTFEAVVLHGMHMSGFQPTVEDDRDAPAAARDLLVLALTRARRALRVIRQSAGSDGGMLAPSPAWAELRRLLPEVVVRERSLGDVVVRPGDVVLDAEVQPVTALQLGLGGQVNGVDPALVADVEALRRRRRSNRLEGHALDELSSMERVAATALERYATCSARWFIEQQLHARDPDDDRTRLVEGVLAHRLLQLLAPDMPGADDDLHAILARVRSLSERCVAEVDPAGVLEPTRVDRVCANVAELLAAEAGWIQADRIEVERSIGSGDDEAIAPGLSVDGVEVVGRVDRIDVHGSHLVLHDYKYGSADRPAHRLVADRNLQLLVYWMALAQPGSPFEPVGGMYRAVTRAGKPTGVLTQRLRDLNVVGKRTKVLDEQARDQLFEQSRQLVAASIGSMRAGIVEPLAAASACPEHCRLQQICRVGEVEAP